MRWAAAARCSGLVAVAVLLSALCVAEATHRVMWPEETPTPTGGDIRRRSFAIREVPDATAAAAVAGGSALPSRYSMTQGDGGCRGYALDLVRGRQYWSTWESHTYQVFYSALDEAAAQRGQVYGSSSFASVGLTLDEAQRLWWIEYTTSPPHQYRIVRRNVAGEPYFDPVAPATGLEAVFPQGGGWQQGRLATALVVMGAGDRGFVWVEANQEATDALQWTYRIRRTDAGGDIETLYQSANGTAAWTLLLDEPAQRLYWIEELSLTSGGVDGADYTSSFAIYSLALNDSTADRQLYYRPASGATNATGRGLVLDTDRNMLFWAANFQGNGTYAVYSLPFAAESNDGQQHRAVFASESRRLVHTLAVADFDCTTMRWMCGGNATLCDASGGGGGMCDCQRVANSSGWTPLMAQCQSCAPDFYGPQCRACRQCGRNHICADSFLGSGRCESTCVDCTDDDDGSGRRADAVSAGLVVAMAMGVFCTGIGAGLAIGYYRYRQAYQRLAANMAEKLASDAIGAESLVDGDDTELALVGGSAGGDVRSRSGGGGGGFRELE